MPLASQAFQSLIHTPEHFCTLRNLLLNRLNAPSTTTSSNKMTVIIDANRPTHVLVKQIWKDTPSTVQNRLILHVPYENRNISLRKNIHQLWSTQFKNTNIAQTRLILGTTTRRKNKLELVRTCPTLSKITIPKLNQR